MMRREYGRSKTVRKLYSLMVYGLLMVFCGCGAGETSGNETEDVIAAMEGSREEGYTVKDLDWGMTEEEVKSAIGQEEPDSQPDRLILQSSKDGLQLVKAYTFADETKGSLVTVAYTWTAESDEEFQSVVESLCSCVTQKIEAPDGGELTKDTLMENGTAVWTASDSSMVSIMCVPQQKTVAVQIHGPREIPDSLMPSEAGG